MPDWRLVVHSRLGRLGLDPGRESEIVTELADHFEDLSEEGIGSGLSEEAAMRRAVREVHDWNQLRHDIRRVELEGGVMKHRMMSIWLPGLVTGALAWLLPAFHQPLGLHPRIVGTAYPPLVIFPLGTLALLPIGALGAYGSRWGGGNSHEMILAGMFPVLVTAALLVLIFPVSLIAESIMYKGASLSVMLAGFGSSMLSWVIIPGAALLAGVLSVTLALRREPVPPSAHV
jgi:hypothetical protein